MPSPLTSMLTRVRRTAGAGAGTRSSRVECGRELGYLLGTQPWEATQGGNQCWQVSAIGHVSSGLPASRSQLRLHISQP